MHVVTIELPQLGNRCHLVHDGASAWSSTRPATWPWSSAAAEEARVDIVAVADTHVHNDYVSGALALARRHGADYLLSRRRAGRVRAGRRPRRRRGPASAASTSRCSRPPATPATTRRSWPGPDPATPAARCSAAAACCTAPSAAPTWSTRGCARDLARAQWSSARALGVARPDDRLLPTHGFGSFCAGRQPAAQPRAAGHHRRPARTQPGAPLDPTTFVDGAGRRLRAGPLLLRAHGPAQPGRRRAAPPRPAAPGHRRARSPTRSSPASGSSTCASGPVRRGPPARHGQRRVLRPVRDVRRLAGAVVRRPRAAHRPAPPTSAPPCTTSPASASRASATHVLDAGHAAAGELPARRLGGVPAATPGAGRGSSTSASATSSTTGHLPGRHPHPVHEVEHRARSSSRRRALGALPLRLPRRHRRQPAAPRRPRCRPRRRRPGSGSPSWRSRTERVGRLRPRRHVLRPRTS